MIREIDHPVIGRMKAMGHPVKSSGHIAEIRMPAPLLGQHTRAILSELGIGETDVEQMVAAGAVYDGARPR
jgi:crotonobetainyl-CoA:carnitine CoA-transferase CaiB-like acyl-CoA transferase